MSETLNYIGGIEYRAARIGDFEKIVKFADIGLSCGDCFVSRGRHWDYLKYYTVLLAFVDEEIIGWAVKQRDGTLIHLLVCQKYRGIGVGATMLRILSPPRVRSKCDQSSGNPIGFYRKLGYVHLLRQKVGKNRNIDILVHRTVRGMKQGC